MYQCIFLSHRLAFGSGKEGWLGSHEESLAPTLEYAEVVNVVERYEARRGTVVRVREEHWKSQFAGMHGTIQKCWGNSEHATVDVLLEDGRSELFWLSNLEAVDVDIAV
jgi:hypothetical protein